MMDVGAFHHLGFQALEVVDLHPHIGAAGPGAVDAPGVAQQDRIFAFVAVKAHQAHGAVLGFGAHRTVFREGHRHADGGLFLGHTDGPGAAVLEQFSVVVVGMAHGPVGEHHPALVHAGGFGDQLGNGPVDVRFADHGNALLVQQAVGRAGHDVDLVLQGVPALDGDGVAAVFLRQGFHGDLQFRHVGQVFILNFTGHVFLAVGNDLGDLGLFRPPLAHFGVQLGQRDGGQLDIELFQQLTLVAHGGPEIEGPGADLQNAGMTEHLDYIAHRQEIPDASFEFGIFQVAVVHVCEGHPEAPQHLAGGKQAALAVAEPHAVCIGPLIPGPPQQHRHVQGLCQTGALIFRAEVGVGQEQAVHLFPLEFFDDLFQPGVVVVQAFFIHIVYIHKVNIHLPQPIRGEFTVFHSSRGAENGPAGRRKA